MRLRKEIGSEFWDVPTIITKNELFPKDVVWFLSGRAALQAIIEDIKKTRKLCSVAIPDWCCDSMILPFLNAGVEVEFYQALKPAKDLKTDAALVMDYFGYTGHSEIKEYDGIIIRDLTHSIMSKKYDDADYYFGSLRKWAGFLTGGYAWGFRQEVVFENDDLGYTGLREKAMQEKHQYIGMRSDSKDYLAVFEKAEELLDNLGILPGVDRDTYLAECLDIDGIKAIRRSNAKILLSELSDMAIFPEMNEMDCPMFVPIRTKDRNRIRQLLIQNEIYCPVHWPITNNHKLSEATQELANEEISLVCDQRYNETDMRRMIDVIKMSEGR